MADRYKVVETTQVDDRTLQRILNETTAAGWRFDGLHLAMRETARRPSMAFVFFVRDEDAAASPEGEDR